MALAVYQKWVDGVSGGRGVNCGCYRILVPLCVLGYSSVLMGKGACVMDFRGIRQMGVVRSLAFLGQAEGPEANTETRLPDL
jgi:hypothetical protein